MSYKDTILAFLSEATEPIDVEKIRKHCGIGNWITALNNCLELFIQGKIKGQKTSKGWVFWAYHERQLNPWEEAIGNFEALKMKEDKVTLTLTQTLKTLKITFPKDSPEAQTIIQTLTNKPKGTRIALLQTDLPEKPLIIKVLNATPVTHKCPLRLLWLRTRVMVLFSPSVGWLRESFGCGCWSCV